MTDVTCLRSAEEPCPDALGLPVQVPNEGRHERRCRQGLTVIRHSPRCHWQPDEPSCEPACNFVTAFQNGVRSLKP